MSELTSEQRSIAHVLFSLPASGGFALAGGSALLAEGAIDRDTRDLDAFISAARVEASQVADLAAQLEAALSADGWTLERARDHPTFVRLVATRDGSEVEVDLAVDSKPLFDLLDVDGLPVLSPKDLAARKVLAMHDRCVARDYQDLFVLANDFGMEACVRWACELDEGVTPETVAGAFRRVDRLGGEWHTDTAAPEIRRSFMQWADTLTLR